MDGGCLCLGYSYKRCTESILVAYSTTEVAYQADSARGGVRQVAYKINMEITNNSEHTQRLTLADAGTSQPLGS